ncbi:MAG TPA: nuclear transport factor 2 family protein [Polyangiaceae bacterium]|nr:nuclear transport factor 2 family protein [Polyangiaceae bacterium]
MAITAAGVLSACSAGTVAAPPPPPVDWHAFEARPAPPANTGPTIKERAVAETYAAALEAPTFAQLASQLDEDPHFAFPGMSDVRGRDAVVGAHAILFGAFDHRKVVTTRVWRTDSAQAVEWTMAGTQERDWMGVAATHKPVTFRGLTLLFTKDDGSVNDIHVYFDASTVKAQLGAGPKDLASLPVPSMPSGPAQILEQTGSPEETANVAAVRSELDALEVPNEAAYLAGMTDDVELTLPWRAQPLRGKEDAARAQFRALHKGIAQLDTTIANDWGVGSFAVVEYWIAGEQVGPIGWVAPSRAHVVRLDVVDVTEVRAGKVARVWRYDNLAELSTLVP